MIYIMIIRYKKIEEGDREMEIGRNREMEN